jgi:NADP-dependent 3-hydroxy acid dehydrogenase YdfG
MPSERLVGRKILVAGASSGMGRATALRFAAEGGSVAVVARRLDPLQSLADDIRHRGGQAVPLAADQTDVAAAEAVIAKAIEQLGYLDTMIVTVGTNLKKRALSVLEPADWTMMVHVNLNSAYHVTRAILPHFRSRGGGLIVFVSSAAVQRPDVSGVAYQATKHGVVGLAHGTMQEERLNGIRTTVIFPGLTDTPLLLKRPTPTPPDVVAKALQPADVAEACLFVATLPTRAYVPELVLLPSQL